MRLPLRGTSQAAGTAFFAGSLLLSLFCFLKILNFPLTRLGRAGPLLFCSCRKVGKRAVQRRSPVGIPLCGRAGAAFGRNSRAKRGYKIGVWRNSSPLRGWSFRADLRKASPAKAVSNVVPCAFAHDKQTFLVWRRGGKGGSKGGRPAPHFGPGIRKGGETPLRLSLPTFCRSRK